MVNNFPEVVGVLGLKREVKRVVLEKLVDPRQVRFLEKFESRLHEEAVILEKQVFDPKTTNWFWFANIFQAISLCLQCFL